MGVKDTKYGNKEDSRKYTMGAGKPDLDSKITPLEKSKAKRRVLKRRDAFSAVYKCCTPTGCTPEDFSHLC
jgi:hypothetical protein